MKISYIGHSSFRIQIDGKVIVIDPYTPDAFGYDFPQTSADILLLSHGDEETRYTDGVSGYEHLIESPGEYEIAGVFIYGLSTYHDAKEGSERGRNTAYLIEDDDFSVLHLGSLGHELSKETLEKIGNVDVLMIPVGGEYVIDAEMASKVISSLEPGVVVPMHYEDKETLEKFLEEMGVEKGAKTKDMLDLRSSGSVPDETKIVVLKPQH